MWYDLLTAIALVLVLEGIMPFISPDALRKALIAAAGAGALGNLQFNPNIQASQSMTKICFPILTSYNFLA